MLVLTRRIGETLMIGDDISITILAVKGNQVRIGIQAPPSVSVYRAEVYSKFSTKRRSDDLNSFDYRSDTLLTNLG
jgi:carbon storage regulator CsrA